MIKKFIILSIFSFVSEFMSAQNADSINLNEALISLSLPEVVVTANRFNSLGINTPEAIRILRNGPVNDYQLRTSAEALNLAPGVFVQKTNHGGGSPFIRGLTGNQTLLLIDGIRLSNSTMRYGPNQYFNTIDVFSLDRIEVLRGSGSVQYGSDAIGGTVQAFSHELTNAEKADWGGSLLTRIATQSMEQSLHAGLSFSNKSTALRAGITWRNFGDIIGGDTTGRQGPTGYDEFDHDFKGKIKLSPKSSLTILYQNVNQKNVPIYHKILLENYAINKTDPQKRKLAYVKLNQEIYAGILKSAVFTASYQQTCEGRESRKNGSQILRNEYDKVRTLGFSAEAIVSNDDQWTGNFGFEIYSDLINSRRTDTEMLTGTGTDKRGLYPNGANMNNMALFTLHSLDMMKWNITAGARFNSFIINVMDQELGLTKLTPSALVGNLAIMRKLNSKSNLFLSINTGFRAPNIDDLGTLGIVDFRYETPNLDLKPESSFQYQAGYKYAGQKLRGDLFIYRNELYNLITRNRIGDEIIEGYPVYQKENSERAYIQGIETAWDFSLNRFVTMSGNITYTYGQNITKNEPVRRIPPIFARMAIDFRHKQWWVNLELLAAGKQDRLAQGDKDDNRIPEGGTPGWDVFNINSGYTWKFMTADLGLRNLFNKDYRYHGSGVNGYGRSLFITLTANL
ncbi:MAG TPA: TonB-dependent receptor [Bacteroidales bacterium]|nr:TonB-dependent receptor [Bacteroidales bacterium]